MKHWIAIASADHVARGREGGFMQVCHGKQGPLKRIHPGDRVAYYSSSQTMGVTDHLQSFTALGTVLDTEPYPFAMTPTFIPFRRDVAWQKTNPACIRPLLDELDFTRGKSNWGYAFRFGILEISEDDAEVIEQAMQIRNPEPLSSAKREFQGEQFRVDF